MDREHQRLGLLRECELTVFRPATPNRPGSIDPGRSVKCRSCERDSPAGDPASSCCGRQTATQPSCEHALVSRDNVCGSGRSPRARGPPRRQQTSPACAPGSRCPELPAEVACTDAAGSPPVRFQSGNSCDFAAKAGKQSPATYSSETALSRTFLRRS